MKGLLYKEWCLGKKTFALFLTLSMVFTVLGILVFLSTMYGNLKTWPETEPGSIKVFATMFSYVPYILILFVATSVNQGIFMDCESGWMKYSYTLPQKPIVIVGTKYLYGLIVFACSFIFGLINAGFICLMSGEKFTLDLVRNLIVILVAAICELAVVTPLAIKFKSGRTLSTVGAVFVMGVYILSGYIMVKLDEKYPETATEIIKNIFDKAMDIIGMLSIPIIVVLLMISVFVSCKLYQRREK
ncbi:MAG: ABC-2 transporter permease [Lachnospiraceae bacterium]|nr:ABC-2 transporter permease [Lachnospiraceae bacterium]